ncbi:MAG: RNA pseudouridine synthase [Saccharofermentans sp.]|nr:RNA pseudouridine synthase [Saccharofermentans sp.]
MKIYLKEPGEDSEELDGSPVGRLDKPVGGLMLLSRNSKDVSSLQGSFYKIYLAACSGRIEDNEGQMNDLLLHDRRKNKSFPVKRMRQGVRDARLVYKVLEYNEENDISLVAVRPITGRTHQIRVQFASRKHPLAGDGKYGSRLKCGISLFASVLSYEDPLSHEKMRFFEEVTEGFPWDLFDAAIRSSVKDLSL